MIRPRARCNESGLTLVELMISLGLLAVVFAGLGMAAQRASALVEESAIVTDVQTRADRAIERCVRLLRNAGLRRLDPNLEFVPGLPPVWTTSLAFEEAIGWNAAVVTWGPITRLSSELESAEFENGLDDNGNGLVDERVLVLTENVGAPDERRVILAHGLSAFAAGETGNGADDNGNGLVDERGLCFNLNGDALRIQLSIQRPGPNGRIITRTRRDSIALRN